VLFSTWEERRRESRVSNLKKIHVNGGFGVTVKIIIIIFFKKKLGFIRVYIVYTLNTSHRVNRLTSYRLPKLIESILTVTDSYCSVID
jgi:hypothetical protein